MRKHLCAFALAGVMSLFAQDAEEVFEAASSENEVNAAQQEVVSADGAASLNEDMQAVVVVSAGSLLDDAFAQYAKERGIAYGVPDRRGVTYVCGRATVKSNVSSAEFIKSRTFAYENAYHDALAKLVLDLAGQEMVTSTREYFLDSSTDAKEAPKSFMEAKSSTWAKTQALVEAKLDQALTGLGVDPAQFDQMKPEQKKNLFMDRIVKTSLRQGVYASSGFLPVQTFEARTEDGTYAIGVVLRYDVDTREIAKCLYQKKRPAISRASGLTIEEALPEDADMLTQFGVRLFFDETGMPSLLSFAQWGSAETSTDPRRQERAMEAALKQAEALANEQLTAFINSSMRVSESSEKSESETEDIIFKEGEDPYAEGSVVKIVDRITEHSSLTASDSMTGRTTVYKKVLRHPSGHQVAMVVRRWSFSQLELVNQIKNGKKPDTPAKPAVEAPKKGDSGVRKGRTYDF